MHLFLVLFDNFSHLSTEREKLFREKMRRSTEEELNTLF